MGTGGHALPSVVLLSPWLYDCHLDSPRQIALDGRREPITIMAFSAFLSQLSQDAVGSTPMAAGATGLLRLP